jgi:hypothetical protein
LPRQFAVNVRQALAHNVDPAIFRSDGITPVVRRIFLNKHGGVIQCLVRDTVLERFFKSHMCCSFLWVNYATIVLQRG